MDWGINVKIIHVGTAQTDPGNIISPQFNRVKALMGIGGGATVTYIQSDGCNMLIDTGFENEMDSSDENKMRNHNRLQFELAQSGLTPESIDGVLITHAHRDHYGNLDMFKHANWYCLKGTRDTYPAFIGKKMTEVAEGEKLCQGTKLLHTPGHVEGHASLLYTNAAENFTIAIAGDAIIDLAWLNSPHYYHCNGDFYSKAHMVESQERLLRSAALIIPGHGSPFWVRRSSGKQQLNE
ncbi:MAG: hypothetical protein PWP51_1481 [Clostridiales bacterium]|nr:hypothetical protein [Clostridiales bacterium]MDN5298928.1 hypothetical protein [Clostridiales bacterium]